MKKLIIPILVLLSLSCTQEQKVEIVQPREQELILSASYGDPETRTERAADGAVLWNPGDQISLFYGSGANGGSCFTSQNTEPAKVVNFRGKIGVITGGNDVTLEDTYFWAVYPYNSDASCDGSSITTTLPSEQVAKADTFADNLFPSIGRSRGLVMGFYNICGGLKFTVSEEGIKNVILKGHNDETIAGTITVGLNSDGLPEVKGIVDGSNSITVSAPEGQTFEVGKAYYIVLLPTVFENGFTLTFKKTGTTAVYDRTKKTTIRRSAFGSLTTPDQGLQWTAPPVTVSSFVIQNYGEIGYSCALLTNSSTFYRTSYVLIENGLGISLATFRKNYEWQADVTYECSSNGSFVATDNYGILTFAKDLNATDDTPVEQLNDVFTLNVNKTQADNIGAGMSKTLYARFNAEGSDVYLGFTFKIGAPPAVSFVSKSSGFWYDDLGFMYPNDTRTNLGLATVRGHANVPMIWTLGGWSNSMPVTTFDMDLDDFWYNGAVKIVKSGTTVQVAGATYKYRFSADNSSISVKGKKWTRRNDAELYWNGSPAVTLTSDGILTFACNSNTKQLINWGTNPQDKADDPSITENYLYCNVDIVAQIQNNLGECCDLRVEQVHVRILRPMNLKVNLGDSHLSDGAPGGSRLSFDGIFLATDWQNNQIFTFNQTTQSYSKVYYPEGSDATNCQIDFYDYFGISQMSIDMDNVETDMAGSYQRLSTVNPSAIFGLINPDDPLNICTSGQQVINMSSPSYLDGWQFFYANNMASSSGYHVKVKVSLTYAWGQMDTYVIIPVYNAA